MISRAFMKHRQLVLLLASVFRREPTTKFQKTFFVERNARIRRRKLKTSKKTRSESLKWENENFCHLWAFLKNKVILYMVRASSLVVGSQVIFSSQQNLKFEKFLRVCWGNLSWTYRIEGFLKFFEGRSLFSGSGGSDVLANKFYKRLYLLGLWESKTESLGLSLSIANDFMALGG